MVDILHRIGVADSSPDKLDDALTTLDGLSGWWASDTKGSAESAGCSSSASGPVASTCRSSSLNRQSASSGRSSAARPSGSGQW